MHYTIIFYFKEIYIFTTSAHKIYFCASKKPFPIRKERTYAKFGLNFSNAKVKISTDA